ncbi:MAG: helix-turn-helix transcriptional regulator [Deinococcus sp.]|uniref:helix-turn-helix domain-containing protein n=1 Tax=Deinococcus sp. TaxID=47478 RepID=UPI0026DC9E7F|nr:helix-turn-helix transcriptional regulator [Deinococcus sp.]MDO4246800.1 helix-turn-helix transcriptional regulator [Deinococcus sp.]
MSAQPSFGRFLWQARCAAGLKLRDAAARLCVHRGYLNRLESGMERPPSNHLLNALARLYGLERDALYVAAGRLPPELYQAAATAEGIAFLRTFAWRSAEHISPDERTENVRLSQQLERA